MKTLKSNRLLKASLLVLCGSFAFVASSAWATLVTWDLNPGGLNAPVGSSSQSYTVSGYTITANGYDNSGGVGTAHELFFKFAGGDEHGLGLVGTLHNELQVSGGIPLQFIQLDLRSILSLGFTNGKIAVGSVQTNESFFLYGSNTLGLLGTSLTGLTPFTSSVDGVFISVPSFGTYSFISVVAAAADVLPVAFQASVAPVPEAASLVPAALLVIVATAFEARRRRRRATAQ